MKARQQLAHLLIFLAGWVYPGKGPGFCFVRNLFGGWAIINESLIRQSACPELKNGFSWEIWSLPDEYRQDFLKASKKRG